MEARSARMEDLANLDKKYVAEVHARLVKVVGAVKGKGFSAKAGVTPKAFLPMTG